MIIYWAGSRLFRQTEFARQSPVVENGTPIEQHDVPHPESSDEVRELAERLRLEHMSRAVVVAQRLWRGGSTACLTARHD